MKCTLVLCKKKVLTERLLFNKTHHWNMPHRTSEKSNQRIENPSILRISGRILNISGLLFLRHFDYQIFWLPNVPVSRLSMSAANQIMSSKRLESIPVLLFSSLRKPLSHMILVRVFVVTDWIVTKQVKVVMEFFGMELCCGFWQTIKDGNQETNMD